MTKHLWVILVGIFLAGLALVVSLSNTRAEAGDTILVDYTISLADGTIYYTTSGRQPLRETLGEGKFIPGFEEAVVGMRVGESRRVRIHPEKAYGQYRSDLIGPVSRDRLPPDLEPVIGQQLQTKLDDGTQALVVITEIGESSITIDANHPLAGQFLTFDIELMAVEKNRDRRNQNYRDWSFLAIAGVSLGSAAFYLRGRWRLQLVKVAGPKE